MKRTGMKNNAFAGAEALDRVKMKAVRGGAGTQVQSDNTRCANTGAVCWFAGTGGESAVGECEEMATGQCRCVERDKEGNATQSVPDPSCLN